MGLFQKAVETYDNMEHLTGVESEAMKAALAPIGFITTGVQIAITVTENGEFVKAEHIFDIFPDSNGKSQKQMKKSDNPRHRRFGRAFKHLRKDHSSSALRQTHVYVSRKQREL